MIPSRTKFVLVFVTCAFVFILGTTMILDQSPESLVSSPSQAPWQSFASMILAPVRFVLMGPLIPFIKFLHQDPDTPPPFFLAGFAFYWAILALVVHFILIKLKRA